MGPIYFNGNDPNIRSNKPNQSIVNRLSARFFGSLLCVFIVIDVILLALFAIGTIYVVNYEAENIMKHLEVQFEECETTSQIEEEIYKANEGLLENLGIEISTESSNRRIISAEKNKNSLLGFVESIKIHISRVTEDGKILYFTKNVGSEISVIVWLFPVFILFQIIILISEVISNRKVIRRTMQPLAELARTANVLNATSDLSPEALKNLAGTLDAINATHLDTRIPMETAKTELKSLTKAINGMLDRIDAAYKSQMRFVSDASHELRTPIAVIEGYANLLDRWGKEDPEVMQEAINAIKSESRAMKEMVEQLLFLARGDNESMVFDIRNLDVTKLAMETLSEIEMINSNHTFERNFKSFEEGEKTTVEGDVGLLKQLMRILIDNSIKYTPDGKNIKIKVSKESESVIFSIQDEGIGITAESLPHIFERFYRTDESRARETGGTGLGLSIAKWIVEKHRGTMEVISRQGIGTRINVSLHYFDESKVNEELLI